MDRARECVDENGVADYFAGALGPAAVDALEAHVDSCVSCRALVDAYAAGSSSGAAAPTSAGKVRARGGAGEPLALAVGQLVAERYRIVRFIAAGGMGEVYEVVDEELLERVALKTMRVSLSDVPLALERFRREVQLARKVTHPNVCRIFDVARHTSPDGDVVFFMTMALLAGESLARKLRRDGALTPAQVLPLARDMAAALDAAHAAGILHRDFKSDNVQLVPEGTQLRAVVTDFGLARSQHGESASLTASNGIVGTPAYMAPEQVENGALTAATDVYAFGVVLFEMLTGKLPFNDASPLAAAARRLREPPPPLRRLRPELDAAWEAVVARCLERDAARRFASAGAALVALERPSRSPALVAGATGAALALLMATGAVVLRERHRRPLATHTTGATTVTARLPARPTALLAHTLGDEGAAALQLDEALAGELRARVLVATGEEARLSDGRWRIEPRLRHADDGTLALTLTATDAHGGAMLAQAEVAGAAAALPELAARAVAELGARLHLPSPSPSLPSLPGEAAAREPFAAALARLAAHDARGARPHLVATVAAEPGFMRARLALAECDAALGYDERAKREAAAAVAALPAGADETARLRVTAAAATAARDWDGALAAWQRLSALAADDPAVAVGLGSAAVDAHHPDELRAAIERLRALRPADPRIDIFAAQADEDDYAAQADASGRAVAAAERAGATTLLASARWLQSHALLQRLDLAGAAAADRAAADAYRAVGDRAGVARAQRSLAGVLSARGQVAAARAIYDTVRADYDALDKPDGTIDLLGELSSLLRASGRLVEAKAVHQRGVELTESAGSHRGSSFYLTNLGEILFEQGDLGGARALFVQALGKRKSGSRKNWAQALAHVAELDFEAARPEAQARLNEALATAATLHAPLVDAHLGLQAARLQLEKGDVAGAAGAARARMAAAARAGLDASSAASLLLTALAASDGADGADEAVAILKGAAARAENPATRADAQAALASWSARAAVARAPAAAGKAAAATAAATLRGLVAGAHAAGQTRRELRLAQALGTIELRWHLGDGRARLQALVARARGLGFERIARHAEATLATAP